MRKEVGIDGRVVALECNAATPIVGKKIFKFDFINFFNAINDMEAGEKMEQFEKVAFTMAVMADKPLKEAMNATEDDFIEWMASFDFPELTEQILPVAADLWGSNQKTMSKPKNANGPQ